MNVEQVAAAVIGFITMYLAMMYIIRQVEKNSTAKGLTAFLAILFAGTALKFLTGKIGSDHQAYAYYAIGLGVGFVAYGIAYALKHGFFPQRTA